MSLPRPSSRMRGDGEAVPAGQDAVSLEASVMAQGRRPNPEGRKKAETRDPKVASPSSLLDELADQGVLAVVDVHAQRQMARERMSGAAETRIVGPEGHLDFVQQAFGDLTAFDQALGRFLNAHGNARGVVRRGDDQVG